VSRSAAGLAIIVLGAIQEIGSFQGFLVAVVLFGLLQLVFGVMRLGVIAEYVPNSVIKGMLAGIGILIILKQIPHALGRDNDYMGDFRFLEVGGNTALSDIAAAVASTSKGALIISAVSLGLLMLWERRPRNRDCFSSYRDPLQWSYWVSV
jgi:MFS superfamily sulfate permease-like transporter